MKQRVSAPAPQPIRGSGTPVIPSVASGSGAVPAPSIIFFVRLKVALRVFAYGADKIGWQGAFVDVTTDRAVPFFHVPFLLL